MLSSPFTARARSVFVRRFLTFSILVLLGILSAPHPTVNGAVGPNFVSETLIAGLTEPTAIVFLPDGRMLILSRYGTIQQVQPGASSVDPVPFMTLSNIDTDQGERGLSGVALDPGFATNHFFYLFYTAHAPLRDRVSRFTMVGTAGAPASESVLWQDDVTSPLWHHGGDVRVGPDGKLYISTGDGFDRANEVQPLTSYRGKILRINLDGTIPTDNPFYDGNGPNKDEIWARGLRNPYRFSFDSATGDMYIGEVGANDPNTSIEEVNRWRFGTPAGLNFGWPICEGNCSTPGMTNPIFSYPHAGRDSCVTGGFVYHGGNFPTTYQGSYFYGDYVQNWIKRLTFDASGNVTAGNVNFEPSTGTSDGPYGEIVYLAQGPDGALYYVDIGISWEGVANPGTVRRIKYTPANQPPVITSLTVTPPSGPGPTLSVSFQATATDPENNPLTYSWVFGDGTNGTGPSVNHTYTTKGPYTARLTVSDGTNQTLSDPIAITVGSPPTVFITAPLDQALFRAGDSVPYQGIATDTDGPLSAANFSWRIVLLHDTHTHPAAGPFNGQTAGTFVVPTTGHELNTAMAFQFILTVTDSDGLQTSAAVVIRPDTVDLSFNSVPSGLTILIDNLPFTTPVTSFNTVKNFQLPLSVTSPQTLGGTDYVFSSWSDGQSQTHTITAPVVGQAYTAQFAQGSATSARSLQFNGTNQRARFTTLPSLSTFTAETWVKRTADLGRYETFLSDASTSYGQETIGIYVDGGNTDCGSNPPDQYAWAYTKVGGGWFFQCSGVQATLNAWHHVAVTRDASNTARMFVDGVLRKTTLNAPASTASTGLLGLGVAGDAGEEYFQGLLDEVRISNVARYTSNFTTQTINFATDGNTVALYHLDEGTGQTVADSSANSRHGVLGSTSGSESIDATWSSDVPYLPPPPAPLPTVNFTATPPSVTIGNASTLGWTTANANDAAIDQGIGTVTTNGTRTVSPTVTTTYTLTATNQNGSTTATTTVTVTPPTPTVTANIAPSSINPGDSAQLSWTTTNATSVSINQGIGAVGTNGTMSVSPTATTTYVVTATNSAGSTTASASVSVNLPPPTATLGASPTSITLGDSSTLTWSTTNASAVTITPGIGAVTPSGTRSVSPTSTTTYTLTATNNAGSATSTTTVTVFVPPVPTVSANISPSSINLGQSALLTWSSTDATTVTIGPGIGVVTASGSMPVSPTTTTTYVVTASNSAGTVSASVVLTVVLPPPPPPTATLSVTPPTIAAGNNATLSWNSTNATTVSIAPGIGTVTASGTRTVSPSATTTYTLTATNISGTATATATLTVTPAPTGFSLKFNGTNQRARFTTLPVMTVFTVEAWVKRTSDTGRYETFLSNAQNGYNQENVGVYVDGGNADCGSSPPDQFAWAYTRSGSGWYFQCSGVQATLNVWHHVAVTRDAANTTRIFVDGVLSRTATNTPAPTSSNGAFGAGDAGEATTEYFPGLLDEIRISSIVRYNVTFTPQVTPFATDASTIALYHFDAGSGQALVDSSGNARNGTLGTAASVEAIDPAWSTDTPVH